MAKDTKTTTKTTAKAPDKTPAKSATKTASKTTKTAAAGTAAPRKVNPALMKPMTPSKELGAVVGGMKPIPRTEVVSKVWEYIKSNKLQNPKNGREILADDKLQKVFGTDKVTMFEMNKHLSKHLS